MVRRTVCSPSPHTVTSCTQLCATPSTEVMQSDLMSPGPSGSYEPSLMSLTFTLMQQYWLPSSEKFFTCATGSSSLGLKSNVMFADDALMLVSASPELVPSHQLVLGSVQSVAALNDGDLYRSLASPELVLASSSQSPSAWTNVTRKCLLGRRCCQLWSPKGPSSTCQSASPASVSVASRPVFWRFSIR